MESYPGQFEVADLEQAEKLVEHCMQYNIVIDLDDLPRPNLVADLIIIKCRELSKFKSL